MDERITLKDVPSGTIDIIKNDGCVKIEFNCSCDDAIPICKAVCCRNRPYYNLLIRDGEKHKFDKAVEHPHHPELTILQSENGHCGYFDSDGCKCNVHSDKPRTCREWHCSPKGGGLNGTGEGIILRDEGFVLIPANGNIEAS